MNAPFKEDGAFDVYKEGPYKDQVVRQSLNNLRLAIIKSGLTLSYDKSTNRYFCARGDNPSQLLDDDFIKDLALEFDDKYKFQPDKLSDRLQSLARQNPFQSVSLSAARYEWIDPTELPRRQWLYAPHYIRGFMSVTVGAGGIAKSTLTMVEALAMVTDKPLLGVRLMKGARPLNEADGTRPLRVWYYNLEDPLDELQRRIGAICKYYKITPEEIGDRLFINSGRSTSLLIAQEERGEVRVNRDTVAQIMAELDAKKIDVMIVDPFVASHQVNENDNSAINLVAATWRDIAEAANCAIMMVHHTRKTNGNEASVEDGRGAGALLAAARSARVLNVMSSKEAEVAEIEESKRRSHFRADNGKANLSPPAERADWYQVASVELGNVKPGPGQEGVDWFQGDNMGVVETYAYPQIDLLNPTPRDRHRIMARVDEGRWRADQRSTKEPWVGVAVAEALDLDLASKAVKKSVIALVKQWLIAGLLKRVTAKDPHGEDREYVVRGPKSVVNESAEGAAAE
jgi:hypothetical protein